MGHEHRYCWGADPWCSTLHKLDTRGGNAKVVRLDGYAAGLSAGSLPPGGSETVDAAAAEAESVILGLRLEQGLPQSAAEVGPLAPIARWSEENGLIERVDGRVRLTTKGRLLSNEIFSRLV